MLIADTEGKLHEFQDKVIKVNEMKGLTIKCMKIECMDVNKRDVPRFELRIEGGRMREDMEN